MTDQLKSYEEFLKAVCQREASGNPQATNSGGYKGCYQIGVPAVVDTGYYKANPGINIYDNKWNEGYFTGKNGLDSLSTFMNNRAIQDKVFSDYKKKQWGYMKDVQNSVGKTIGGIPITESGMLGAAQMGHGKVIDYIKSNGRIIGKDGNGVPVTEFLDLYKGYDVSNITHPQVQPQQPKAQKSTQQREKQQLPQNTQKNILRNMMNPAARFESNSVMYKNKPSFPTGYAAPVDNIFTPEQIGSMSPSEFTQNEPAIMSQLQQGLIGNPEVDLINKYSGYTNPLTGNNRIFSAEDIGNLSGSEYSKYEPEINAQWGSLGIPSNNELHQASMNGGTVYVNGYTRSDGTPVRGYYRSV